MREKRTISGMTRKQRAACAAGANSNPHWRENRRRAAATMAAKGPPQPRAGKQALHSDGEAIQQAGNRKPDRGNVPWRRMVRSRAVATDPSSDQMLTAGRP